MDKPCIILVEPQLGQNIGMCARAMKNFALSDLRLVSPRSGRIDDEAFAASSGARDILERAKLFDSLEAAVADLTFLYATTARPRDMVKPVLTLRDMVADYDQRRQSQEGLRTGLLFGRERTGLYNQELAISDALVMFPANPHFSSLNLAQAVLLTGYELFHLTDGKKTRGQAPVADYPIVADKSEVMAFFQRLDNQLEALNYYHPPEKRDVLKVNLQNLLVSMSLTSHHIRLLHGVLSTLMREAPWGEGST